MILDIVRGFGYVMIAGHDITGWPGYGQLKTLPGIAMAAGIARARSSSATRASGCT